MGAIKSIDRVLTELDSIIDRSVLENDFSGLFAYVCRRTTAEIRQGILKAQFHDNERMEHFDVVFARLYIDAYNAYKRGDRPSASWLVCFESRKSRLFVSQRLHRIRFRGPDRLVAYRHPCDQQGG